MREYKILEVNVYKNPTCFSRWSVREWDEDNEFTGYYSRNWVQWHYANDVRLYEEKEIEIY